MMILMLVEYFSIVRRRAAWASRDKASASLMITTAYERLKDEIRDQ
jgi:hypothetical protein